ncbi:MAG: class I tRNA ligase family protein [Patescibacteria group bacterium]
MENLYQPEIIEPKWQAYWEKNGTFRHYDREEKFYILDMFPYPSGAGLHVGHPKGYIATDVLARMKQIQGKAVLHPMGWDAFGLPAEEYAIKNKMHPSIAVRENIATFKKQLELIGFTYDWEREINTTDPEYYRWTQWIFLQMWKAGLAYESQEPINWCPTCKTGLANEDLEAGKCERCGSEVEKKPLRQWVLAMTQYADRLLYDLDSSELDWASSIKEQQRNWIGRSEGTEIVFPVVDTESEVRVFTTRVDTLYGCAYVVVAPEHSVVRNFKFKIQNWSEVETYLEQAKKKTEMERTELNKEKTGILLEGIGVAHPFTGVRLPVYVADYVLATYGTGAVMGVPAHDERDYEFAQKYDINFHAVIEECEVIKGERDDAYRPGVEVVKRENVVAGVYDPKLESFLAISWKDFDMRGVPTGGLEDGESIEDCARREILEETGYKNLKLVTIPEIKKHTKFFHRIKKINRHAVWNFVLFELIDDEREVMSAEDQAQHEVIWVKQEDAKKFFAKTSEAKWVVELFEKHDKEGVILEDGILVDSGEFTGMTSADAREQMTTWLAEEGLGNKKVNYKMRDWTFSRQRYWGEPIPLIHCADCGVVAVPESELPVRLPEVESYEPNDSGESPLANITEWVNVSCPTCGKEAKRETNTMPQWAGSCWYYLRFIDPKNKKTLVDPILEKKMMPVDVYVGGTEHATRHLLYARFWHKFLFDQGVVSTEEPFKKLVNQGLILASDGRKMSKRWGNVINPDEMVGEFGADAFRLYEMFMGPFTQSIAWNTDGVVGTRRFVEKVWKLQNKVVSGGSITQDVTNLLQTTIKKVTEDIEEFKFNTAVSSLMILVNALEKEEQVSKKVWETLLILLAPFAPHITEELWEKNGGEGSIFETSWPSFDASKVVVAEVTLMVQINGKIRDQFQASTDLTDEEVEKLALAREKVQEVIGTQTVSKIIVVPNKLISIVIS